LATNYPAWVRIYSSVAARTADSGRAIDTDPTGEHGVLLEVLTTTGNLIIDLAPAAMCYSLEDEPSVDLPITITNKDSQQRAITVTVTALGVEA
jgi:hypothetical protein